MNPKPGDLIVWREGCSWRLLVGEFAGFFGTREKGDLRVNPDALTSGVTPMARVSRSRVLAVVPESQWTPAGWPTVSDLAAPVLPR